MDECYVVLIGLCGVFLLCCVGASFVLRACVFC